MLYNHGIRPLLGVVTMVVTISDSLGFKDTLGPNVVFLTTRSWNMTRTIMVR